MDVWRRRQFNVKTLFLALKIQLINLINMPNEPFPAMIVVDEAPDDAELTAVFYDVRNITRAVILFAFVLDNIAQHVPPQRAFVMLLC